MTFTTVLRAVSIVAPVALFLFSTVRKSPKTDYETFRGVVDQVDLASKHMVIRSSDQQRVFRWDEDCRIYDIDQAMTMPQLQPGTSVAVKFKKQKGSESLLAKVEVEALPESA